LTAGPPAPAGGEDTPFSGGKLAETDDADTGNLDKPEGELTAANRDWLGRVLWDGPSPSVAHLLSPTDVLASVPLPSLLPTEAPAAGAPPVPVEVPADLFDGFADIETVEIIGLPEGAAMNAGRAGGEGVWLLEAGDVVGLELLPADGHWSVANLTVKVTATEAASGDKVTNMAAIRMEIAGSPSEAQESGETAGPPEQPDGAAAEDESQEADGEKDTVDIRHLVPPPPEPRPQPELAADEDVKSAQPEPAATDVPEEAEPAVEEGVAEREDSGQAEPAPAAAGEIPAEPDSKTASVRLQPAKAVAKVAAAKAPAARPTTPQTKRKAGASVQLRPATVRKVETPSARPSTPPETPSVAKPAARKAGVVLRKPEKPSPPPTPAPTPGDRRRPTGEIVVRLGGAPERGDPHYRIAVDGRQVASGNVDWTLGLPAIEDGGEGAVCWQTVRFPWDFATVVPDEISLRYELGHGSEPDEAGALLVDWIDIDGLRVRDGEPYAHADDGRVPWPGSDRLKSWIGELVFDVGGAFAGEPRRKRDKKPNGTASSADADEEPGKAAQGPTAQPLVVRVSEDDAADSVVMSELAALRSFVRGRDDPRIDPGREGTYDRLGLASGSWSDVVAIGPDGKELDLDRFGGAKRFSVTAGEDLKRKFLTEAAKRAPFDGQDRASGDRKTDDGSTAANVSVETGREIKRRFLAGMIDRLSFLSASGPGEPVEADEPEEGPRSGAPAVYDQAFDVKRKFLDGIVGKGLARLETVLRRPKDRPMPAAPLSPIADVTVEAPVPVRIGDGDPISKRQAVRRFYGRTLKRALDKLQSTVFDDSQPAPQPSRLEGRRSPPGPMSGGHGEAATRDFAERMRSEFFDNAMRKAMARGASPGIDGRG